MSEIKVLEFKIEMMDECVDLFIDVFSKDPWYDVYDSRERIECFFKNHIKNNNFLGYVAIRNEEIVGVSIGFIKPWVEGLEYYIDEFYVKYSEQNTGIGTNLMNKIEEDLKKKNINGCILLTDRDFPSHKFYVKNKFSIIDDNITLVKEI